MMKHSGKARVAAFLAAAALLPSLTACGGGTITADEAEQTAILAETAGIRETDAQENGGLPDRDLDGFTLRISSIDRSEMSWTNIQILPDETGDVLNDAINRRNLAVEERFNCDVSVYERMSIDTNQLHNMIASGSDDYDLYLIYDVNLVPILDCAMPWNDLPYVDLTQEWWNPDATAVFNINGVQYVTAGNINMGYLSRAMCYLFNKNMYRSLGNEEKDLYDIAKNGAWTQETFYRIAGTAVADLDGNGVFDENDQYGLFGNARARYNTLMGGAGVSYVSKNTEGSYVFDLPESEKAIERIETILRLDTLYPHLTYNTGAFPWDIEPEKLFSNGQALFHIQGLPNTIEQLRSMEDDFGILPLPKADEAQSGYRTLSYGSAGVILPKTLPEARWESVGLVTEALTREAQTVIVPVYKETVLKTKYSRDEESAEMLDIMFSTIQFDPGILLWCNKIADEIVAKVFMKENTAFVSYFEQHAPEFEKLIDAVNHIGE